MKRLTAALIGASIGVAFLVACSSSDDATGQVVAGACSQMANRCHPWASKSKLANDCHELGHGSTDDLCSPKLNACLAECPETDAALPFQIVDGQVVNLDSGSEAGNTDSGVDAGPDLCTPYCECVVATCSTNDAYPYGDAGVADQKGTCMATCKANLNTDQITCWTDHCGAAKNLSEVNRGHECRHAIGLEGLDECD